jgi:hypothetical protein
MGNRSNPRGRDAARAATGDAPTLDAVKGFVADFERLKAHVDGATLRQRAAEQSMSVMTAYLAGGL